jgi:hypothetical protein
MKKEYKLTVVSLLVVFGAAIASFPFAFPESEIYVSNGSGKTVRVVDLRVTASLVDSDAPFDMKSGATGFMSFRSFAGAPRRLEVVLDESVSPAIMSCELEAAARRCFFRVFLTPDNLECDRCDNFPRAF